MYETSFSSDLLVEGDEVSIEFSCNATSGTLSNTSGGREVTLVILIFIIGLLLIFSVSKLSKSLFEMKISGMEFCNIAASDSSEMVDSLLFEIFCFDAIDLCSSLSFFNKLVDVAFEHVDVEFFTVFNCNFIISFDDDTRGIFDRDVDCSGTKRSVLDSNVIICNNKNIVIIRIIKITYVILI